MLVTATLCFDRPLPMCLSPRGPFGPTCHADVRALQNTDGSFGDPSTQRLTMSSQPRAEHVCTIASGELKSGISFHPAARAELLRICCGPKPESLPIRVPGLLDENSQGGWCLWFISESRCLSFHRRLIRWLTAPRLSPQADEGGPNRSDSRAIFPR